MSDTHNEFEHQKMIGGVLCLDFVNTVSARDTASPTDRLPGYEDLLAWAERVEIITADAGARLRTEAARQPVATAAVLERAISLREALFRIFHSVIEGAQPAADDLAVLNANVAASYPYLRLARSESRFVWTWAEGGDKLDQILWPVVRSAAEVLTSGELERIRMCAGEHCGWLFIDHSKNRSRRWCDMQECGNVAKVRRYRRRQQP